LFWLFIRFISAILPLITIYQFSGIIKLLENKATLESLIVALLAILLVRILDNYLRLLSIVRLEYEISCICFDVHNFFLSDLKTSNKTERHEIVQAIRNFSDASSVTLNLIKQPGVDSFVSVILIPVVLLFIDFRIFVLNVAYILVYFFIDIYTTQRYAYLKNILNLHTETYYGKLQETNDFELEQTSWSRHYRRLANWGFTEWNFLQNAAVFFYTITLFFLIYLVINGDKQISDLVLMMGYVSQTQIYLNAFSTIKDSLTDMLVGLERLSKDKTFSTVDLDDLI
jgi:hypothetical protein